MTSWKFASVKLKQMLRANFLRNFDCLSSSVITDVYCCRHWLTNKRNLVDMESNWLWLYLLTVQVWTLVWGIYLIQLCGNEIGVPVGSAGDFFKIATPLSLPDDKKSCAVSVGAQSSKSYKGQWGQPKCTATVAFVVTFIIAGWILRINLNSPIQHALKSSS